MEAVTLGSCFQGLLVEMGDTEVYGEGKWELLYYFFKREELWKCRNNDEVSNFWIYFCHFLIGEKNPLIMVFMGISFIMNEFVIFSLV